MSPTKREKLNHKSLELKGFDKNRIATVGDWDGALGSRSERAIANMACPAPDPSARISSR